MFTSHSTRRDHILLPVMNLPGLALCRCCNSRNHFQNVPSVKAAFSVATRIKKFLLRRKHSYFRLRLLQHNVLSNLKRTDIQEAIGWMIDEGDIAKTSSTEISSPPQPWSLSAEKWIKRLYFQHAVE